MSIALSSFVIALQPKKQSKVKKGKKEDKKEGAETAKAVQARAVLKKGVHMKKQHKVWTKPSFRTPKTKTVKRTPKYTRISSPKAGSVNNYDLIRYPLISEAASGLMENQNTLVFIVNLKATKNGKLAFICNYCHKPNR